jgi:WD40 repeat protein
MDTERRELGLWTLPEGRFQRSFTLGDQGATYAFEFSRDGKRLFTSTETPSGESLELKTRSWPVEGGEPDLLAILAVPKENGAISFGADPFEPLGFAWSEGRRVHIARLEDATLAMASATSVEHDRTIAGLIFDERGRQLATSDPSGTIQIWSLERDPPELTHTLSGATGTGALVLRFDPSGSRLAGVTGLLWDLTGPPGAEPLRLRGIFGLAFDPTSRWLATGGWTSFSLWPLARSYPQILRGHEDDVLRVAFTPDGRQLVSTSEDRSVRVWPLGGSPSERPWVLGQSEGTVEFSSHLAMAPDASLVVTGNPIGEVRGLPLDGSPVRELRGFTGAIKTVAVGPQARLVAAGAGHYFGEDAVVRVWDLVTNETRVLDVGDGEEIRYLEFTVAGDLLAHSGYKLRRWGLAGDVPRVLAETDLSGTEQADYLIQDISPGGDEVLFIRHRRLWIQDLGTDASRELSSRGRNVLAAIFDPTGNIIVSSDPQGIRVGPARGGEPHLLLAAQGWINCLAVSPDGRWIASGANDDTIRLWPMPDLEKPPLHTLPRDELLAKLRSLTNLRAVEDPDSPSGWKIEAGPFPGWEEVPTW